MEYKSRGRVPKKKYGTYGCVSIRIIQYNLWGVNGCRISGRLHHGLGGNLCVGNGGICKYFGILGCRHMETKGLSSVQEVMMDTYVKSDGIFKLWNLWCSRVWNVMGSKIKAQAKKCAW